MNDYVLLRQQYETQQLIWTWMLIYITIDLLCIQYINIEQINMWCLFFIHLLYYQHIKYISTIQFQFQIEKQYKTDSIEIDIDLPSPPQSQLPSPPQPQPPQPAPPITWNSDLTTRLLQAQQRNNRS
jgi:hypothetical protein